MIARIGDIPDANAVECSHAHDVRFVVEIHADDAGHVSGEVVDAVRGPAPFTGWLELVHLLEGPHDTPPQIAGGVIDEFNVENTT